jgi:GTP cyclohydrolase I
VTVTASINDHLWIEELVAIRRSQASCELYGLLKRPDEKYVTERAYDNPKFVEDMVRDVAARLNAERASMPMWSSPRTSSRSTIIRRTR